MIQANELRIGNIVQFSNGISEPETLEVNLRFFASLAGGKSHDDMLKSGREPLSGYYSPIPLTPEWLEKFGYESMGGNIYEKSRIQIKVMDGDWHFSLDGFYWYASLSNQKYVHQLQNLYFALTSEELTVKQ